MTASESQNVGKIRTSRRHRNARAPADAITVRSAEDVTQYPEIAKNIQTPR